MATWDLLSNIEEVQGLMALDGLDTQEHPGEYLQTQLECTTPLETHAVHHTSQGWARVCPPAWVLPHKDMLVMGVKRCRPRGGVMGLLEDLGKPQRPRVFPGCWEDTDPV